MKVKGFVDSLQKNSPPLTPPPSGEGNRTGVVIQNYYESPNYLKEVVLKLRKNQTPSEEIMWEVLRWKQLAWLKFRRQHPFGRYIADFFCSKEKIVIEIDGKIHDNQKEYDDIRESIIEQYWVKILRFSNDQISNNLEEILEEIVLSLPPEGGKVRTFEILAKTPGSWIIYCSSRKAVKEVYDFLIGNWIKAWMYTWAMTADKREQRSIRTIRLSSRCSRR